MKKIFAILLISTFLLPLNNVFASGLSNRLKGKILLQVESAGEAWYVNPDNEKRYYLGRPADAFQAMRELGLGISNKDFDSFINKAPSRLSGKILIKVEDNGKAYYVNPTDLKMHYLGRPEDAFQIMRKLGLGITNKDLTSIIENGEIDTANLKTLSNFEIVQSLKDSVVYIETDGGAGSGFIIESTGYILTNAHVVRGVNSVNIIFSNNSTSNASVIGRDENIDIALLKVDKTGLKNSILGDSDAVKQGDEIFTLGYPFGIKGDVSFKEGIISRKLIESNQDYFEISAEIHPGNSGGPLVDRYGQVIGINTATYGKSIQGINIGETIKFTIPVNTAKGILDDLKKGKNIVIVTSDDVQQKEKTNNSTFINAYNLVINSYASALKYSDSGIKQSLELKNILSANNSFNLSLESFKKVYDNISQLNNSTEDVKLQSLLNALYRATESRISSVQHYINACSYQIKIQDNPLNTVSDYDKAIEYSELSSEEWQQGINKMKEADTYMISVDEIYKSIIND